MTEKLVNLYSKLKAVATAARDDTLSNEWKMRTERSAPARSAVPPTCTRSEALAYATLRQQSGGSVHASDCLPRPLSSKLNLKGDPRECRAAARAAARAEPPGWLWWLPNRHPARKSRLY